MWDIKSYNKKGKEIVLQSGFSTREEAEIFLAQEYKNEEEVFVEEKIEKNKEFGSLDISDKIGQWIWLHSSKRNEMFPYGILRKSTPTFAKIQTKEDETELIQMVDFRTNTIVKWLESGKGEFRSDGHFVIIKEYV